MAGGSLSGAIETKRATVAAAAITTPLWTTANGNVQDWTGTPTITDYPAAPQAGSSRVVYPTAGTIITNGGNITVQGNANYTIVAGDELTITAITTTTFYVTIKRKDGLPVVAPQSVLPGTRIAYTGTSAPAGYLACPTAQTNISRTTYAALFTAIGTTWGVGDGSTTFGMPWYPADYAPVQSSGNVGSSTLGQIPAHTHSLPNVATTAGGSSTGYSSTVNGVANVTGSFGTGTATLSAGVRELFCVKY